MDVKIMNIKICLLTKIALSPWVGPTKNRGVVKTVLGSILFVKRFTSNIMLVKLYNK